jgi:pimeloyl-ACP methyl ester carboxylesterase
LEALLTKTDTHYVFGLSSGAIIVLQAAITLPIIHKAVIFEPPLFIDSSPTAILTRYDKEIAKGKIASALITGMKGAKMGPAVFNLIPNWLLASLVNKAMASEDKKGPTDYISMRALAPLLHYDFELVVEKSEKLESFKAVQSEVLLLGGSKSPGYLKAALGELEKILPNVKRIELSGLGHAASWNTDRGGQPEPVAQVLRQFFS